MAPDRVLRLQKNKKLMFFMRLFVEIKAFNAVATLFYLSRGIGLDSIFYLLVVWSVVGLILEIPSGYLADRIGRKQTIMLGVFLHAISIAILFFADNFFFFALSMALQSAAYTGFTGTDSALIYDSLRELGDTKSSLRVSGKYFSSVRFAKIFIPLLGAIIAKDLLPYQFNILIAADLAGAIVSLAIASKLTEPDKTVDLSEKETGIFTDSLKLFRKDEVARRFAINKSLVFISTLIFWRLYQPILKDLGLSVILLGVLYAAFQLLNFLAHWYFDRLEEKLSTKNLMTSSVILGIFCLTAFLVTKNIWVLAIASVPVLTLGTLRDPAFFEQINLRVKSFNRATTTSVLNVVKSVFDIPILILTGSLSVYGYIPGLLTGILLFLIALIFFPIRGTDIIRNND